MTGYLSARNTPVTADVRPQSAWQSVFDMLALLPRTLREANRRAADLVECFEKTLDPVLSEHLPSADERMALRARMLPFAVKVAFFIQNYAQLIGESVSLDLSLTVGAFTRVYDDLMDEMGDAVLSERLRVLFHGGVFEPTTSLENLFFSLYRLLDDRLPQMEFPTCHQALVELHAAQTLSLAQRMGRLSHEELLRITLLKGAKAELVFCGVVRQDMGAVEKQLIEELGACFQYMDDYEDLFKDRWRGVTTLATQGSLPMRHITGWIAILSTQLAHYYGLQKARPFVTHIHYWATIARMGRVFQRLGLKRGGVSKVPLRRKRVFPIEVLMS